MSLFLKQTKTKNRIFLQISETTYDKVSKKSSNKCYKKLGFLDELISEEIKDPIAYYKNEVEKLNENRKKQFEETKKLKIDERREKRVGYFVAKSFFDFLGLKEKFFDFCKTKGLDTYYYEIIENLIFSKIISISSSRNSVKNSLSFLYNEKQYNNEQIYSTLEFLGKYYQEISDILGIQIKNTFKTVYKNTFFDSFKSFYNVNGNEICVTQSILMDEDIIPFGLSIEIENSNKNSLGKILKTFQLKYNPEKIIRVADRGINYGNNLYNAIIHDNGYILPLPLSSLVDDDKEWLLNENDYENIYYSNGNLNYKTKEDTKEYLVKLIKNDGNLALIKAKQKRVAVYSVALNEKKRSGINNLVDQAKVLFYSNAQKSDYSKSLKYITIVKQPGKPDKIEINQEKIDSELKYAGYKMIVTSENNFSKENLFKICDTVWKIENYYQFLKDHSNDDSENTKNENRIKGNLLTGFYVITIYRLIESKIFKNKYAPDEIVNFIKSIKLLEIGDIYINLLTPSPLVNELEKIFDITLSNVYFKKSQIEKLFSLKIKKNIV